MSEEALRLALEATARRGIGYSVAEKLDRDAAIQFGIEREIYGPHPALAEASLDAVGADLYARSERSLTWIFARLHWSEFMSISARSQNG